MLCLILKRLACDALRSGINKLKRSAEQNVNKINRMQKISSINSEICKLLAWHKIKSYVSNKKAKNRIIKDAFILGKQI